MRCVCAQKNAVVLLDWETLSRGTDELGRLTRTRDIHPYVCTTIYMYHTIRLTAWHIINDSILDFLIFQHVNAHSADTDQVIRIYIAFSNETKHKTICTLLRRRRTESSLLSPVCTTEYNIQAVQASVRAYMSRMHNATGIAYVCGWYELWLVSSVQP